MAKVKQRKAMANYLNVGTGTDEYVLMGAGFIELNELPAAQVSAKKYINDKSETKSITGYDWSTAFTTDQIKDEKAIEFICNIGEKQLIGSEAETTYVVVDLDKNITDSKYKARKFNVAIEVAEFGNEEGIMTAVGNLLSVGDIILGSFDTSTKSFVAETI